VTVWVLFEYLAFPAEGLHLNGALDDDNLHVL
jgi:hypothetical protein